LTTGTISRLDSFSTLYVGGPIATAPSRTTAQFTITGQAALGGAGQTVPILPWIGGDHGTPSATGCAETLFKYTAGGLVALDSTTPTNFAQVTSGPISAGRNNVLTCRPPVVSGSLSIFSLVI